MNRKIPEINFERLYDMAVERDEVSVLENNLFNLYHLNRHNYEIRRIFHNRRLLIDEKLEFIKRFFGTGVTVSKLFYDIVYILLKYKLDHKMYYIYEGYSKVVEEKGNKIIVQVYTAIPVDILLFQEIKQTLAESLGKKVILKNFIDRNRSVCLKIFIKP